jgi:hypothetical protein
MAVEFFAQCLFFRPVDENQDRRRYFVVYVFVHHVWISQDESVRETMRAMAQERIAELKEKERGMRIGTQWQHEDG